MTVIDKYVGMFMRWTFSSTSHIIVVIVGVIVLDYLLQPNNVFDRMVTRWKNRRFYDKED